MQTHIIQTRFVIITLALASNLLACSDSVDSGAEQQSQLSEMDPEQLAARYVFEEIEDPAVAEELLETIRSLDQEDMVDFAWWVVEHQRTSIGADETNGQFVLALAERGAPRGMPFFDLSETEVEEVARAMIQTDEVLSSPVQPEALCVWPWKSCQYTTAWNGEVYGLNYTPASGWLTGYASDRTSNSQCEELDCDYRLAYNVGATKRNSFFARTSAALCVQNAYSNLFTYKSGSTQFTLVGYYKTSKCGVASGSYLYTYLALK